MNRKSLPAPRRNGIASRFDTLPSKDRAVGLQAAMPVMAIFCMTLAARGFCAEKPNIILMMADDQGWGETGYYAHPILKTPNLDAMSQSGLRFDRFYAGAPVCSPTRASVLTGRSNNRTGVETHGYPLRLQEKTLAQALQAAGYRTAHFGKWHLNGLRGPGVPILSSDNHNPGVFGFDEWLSVTNFFDRNPILSRKGEFEDYQGDSSEIVVGEALKFISEQVASQTPFFTVIWFGTPHAPFMAAEEDMRPFAELDEASRHHYGELVALDRSVGAMRKGLRDLGIAPNTLFWYCSDNGGLPRIEPETVGGLRGFKGSLYEGGLRVPSIIEWPNGIPQPRVTQYPSATMDIFPTLVDILGLPETVMLQPQDGLSLQPVFSQDLGRREKPIPFNCFGETAIIDNDMKLLRVGQNSTEKDNHFELYNLRNDPKESVNLMDSDSDAASRLEAIMRNWLDELDASIRGKDYPEGEVHPGEPAPRYWTDVPAYRPYFDDWRNRPEYKSSLKGI